MNKFNTWGIWKWLLFLTVIYNVFRLLALWIGFSDIFYKILYFIGLFVPFGAFSLIGIIIPYGFILFMVAMAIIYFSNKFLKDGIEPGWKRVGFSLLVLFIATFIFDLTFKGDCFWFSMHNFLPELWYCSWPSM